MSNTVDDFDDLDADDLDASADDQDDSGSAPDSDDDADAKAKAKARADAAKRQSKEPAWVAKLPEAERNEARRHLDQLRKNAAGNSAAARRAREQLEELKQSGMSDAQKAAHRAQQAEERATRAEEKLRETKILGDLERAARTARARNPERVAQMLVNSPDLDYSDELTTVLNAEELVLKLRVSDDYLFLTSRPQGGADAGRREGAKTGTGSDFMNAMIRGRTTGGRRR